MATYTTTANASGDFSVDFPTAVNGGQKVTITATKDLDNKTIELSAPSGIVGGGAIVFLGDMNDFPLGITGIELSSSVTGDIATSAFAGNTSGTFFRYAQTLKVGGGVRNIGDYAFAYWTALTTAAIEEGVTGLGTNTFSNCAMMTTISLPATLKTIGNNCFSSSIRLETINFPTSYSLESIGTNAFNGISSLVSFPKFPATLKSLGQNAFQSTKLASIDLSECYELTTIGANCFNQNTTAEVCLLPPNLTAAPPSGFRGVKSPTLVIPSTVTNIGGGAFQDWSACTALTIPAAVTVLGNNSFDGWTACKSLTFAGTPPALIPQYCFQGWSGFDGNLALPSGIVTINPSAFSGWGQLKELTIPDTVASIAASAFYGLTSLTKLRILRETPPTIQYNTFTNLSETCIIEVPSASLAAYQAATNWATHASKMIGV